MSTGALANLWGTRPFLLSSGRTNTKGKYHPLSVTGEQRILSGLEGSFRGYFVGGLSEFGYIDGYTRAWYKIPAFPLPSLKFTSPTLDGEAVELGLLCRVLGCPEYERWLIVGGNLE